ncbi:hypothetical protein EIP86_001110 [Pleurotus ostreatoroseus]|nr:hypothetical protein EIP86_001110 [Pleurotus ostreatoroseus]
MPPRPRTRSATKKSDTTSTSASKPVRKSVASSAKRTKIGADKSSEVSNTKPTYVEIYLVALLHSPLTGYAHSAKSRSRVRNKTELLEGIIEDLSEPITVPGNSNTRRRRKVEDADEDVQVNSGGVSANVDDSIADLDLVDSDDPESQDVALLDLEAEVDDDDSQTDDEEVADLDIDEDPDTYESSFIDDSALYERDEEEVEESVAGEHDVSGDEVMSAAEDRANSIQADDDDDVPLARPKKKASPSKRRTVVSDDDASPTRKKMRKFNSAEHGDHPLNPNSDLHEIWFGDTNRLQDWNRWRREQIMNNRKMTEVSGTNLEAAFLSQYNDFNFIVENNLLPTYTAWVEQSETERRKDKEWMSHFEEHEDSDEDVPVKSRKSSNKSSKSASTSMKHTPLKAESSKAPRTPKKDTKGKSTARTKVKPPTTPKTPSNHLVAGVMFGVAAAESTLLVPVLTKGSTAMYSKSITMWPINEHFSRITSLANKFFNQYPLKFALYQKGISFRTRMVPPSGKPPGGLDEHVSFHCKEKLFLQ